MIATDCFPGFSTGTATASVSVVPGRVQHPDTLTTTTTGWSIEEYVPERGRVIAAPGPVSLRLAVDVGKEVVTEGFRPWTPYDYEYKTCIPANRWVAGVGMALDSFNRLVRWEDLSTSAAAFGNDLVASVPMRIALGLGVAYPQFHYLTNRGWTEADAVIVPSSAGLSGHPKAFSGDLPLSAVVVAVLDKAAQISAPKGIVEFAQGNYAIRCDVIEGRSIGLSTTTNSWSTWASSGNLVFCGTTGMVVAVSLWYGAYTDEAHGLVHEARVGISYGVETQPATPSDSVLTVWQPEWQGYKPTTVSIGSPYGTGMAVLEAALFTGYDWMQTTRQATQLVSYYMNRRHYAV